MRADRLLGRKPGWVHARFTKRSFVVVAVVVLLAAVGRVASGDSFSSIVVYGDSLSDNGNLYAATGQPGAPYVNGEFSNGLVAVQQLATLLNAPLLDFAFGGATTGVGKIGDGGTPSSFGAYHLPGMQTELAASAGLVPSAAIPGSLFIVWGGADDFESLVNPTIAQSQAAAVNAATNIDGIVAALELEGATNILVPNLPNLGGTPEFHGNAAAIAYSNTFDSALAVTLPSGATLFDTNALFSEILGSPGAYGFTNTTTPCLVASANPACTGYLFFDDIHPTTAADTILAEDFKTAAAPEPSSVLLLGTALVGGTELIRRRKLAGAR